MTATENTSVDIVAKVDADVDGLIAELESRGTALSDRERLRIIHELCKHVYLDTPKRNFTLLTKIHKYSYVVESL